MYIHIKLQKMNTLIHSDRSRSVVASAGSQLRGVDYNGHREASGVQQCQSTGEPQGQGSLVGCCLWGRTESDTTGATQQQPQCQSLSCVGLFVTPRSVTHQAPLSMGFSTQLYWSGLPFPSPEDLPNLGIQPGSPALQADSLVSEPQGRSLGSF